MATAMLAASALFAWATPRRATPPPIPVRLAAPSEYVSSAACKTCHPSEYASWHATYHRTMTQAASASLIAAPIRDGVTLSLDGLSYGLARRGDEVWAALPGGSSQRVAMTTGSHHYQAYWLEGLTLFPFVYLLGDERRWIPRREAFVQPPGSDGAVRWGSNCIQCHATAGSPGEDPARDAIDPTVAELGIACEACHGPGAAHAQKHANPLERYAAYAEERADPTIVNPSRLSPERASMICGACHAFTYPRDEDDFWAHGYTQSFRPGQDLGVAKIVLTRDLLARPGAPTIDTAPENLFYDDGTVRIGGREYNGLVASACFLRGEGDRKLGCLSCHSMHDSAPAGQLARDKDGDAACSPCHDEARYGATSHTHHAAGSVGASCMGCHMPRTSYALLKSIRSHRIDSPLAKDLGESDRPNACNLCHLDQTLAWTASHLASWYGQRGASAPAEGVVARAPAGAAWLLAGDPGQRAIAAAALGSLDARAATGGAAFPARVLGASLDDPYAAVRFIAARSRRALPASSGAAGLDPAVVDALVAARSPRALTLSE